MRSGEIGIVDEVLELVHLVDDALSVPGKDI
jgi:hypothetical protein